MGLGANLGGREEKLGAAQRIIKPVAVGTVDSGRKLYTQPKLPNFNELGIALLSRCIVSGAETSRCKGSYLGYISWQPKRPDYSPPV